MSRVLPARPNLEHLRNQAKDLLRELQRDQPGAQLADAQHAIAREYGFASWPRLKAHVESLVGEARSAPPAVTEHPLAGTWIANVDASRRHPANAFQSATLRIEVAGDRVTITHDGIGASGQAEHSVNTLQVDGEEHPSEQRNGYAVIARWLGSRVLETVATRAGRVVGGGTYEVSADGKTLTASSQAPGANADGWSTDIEQVIVFDRA